MKTVLYLNGRKKTRKYANAKVGEDKLKRLIDDAKEQYKEDDLTENDYRIGTDIWLTIKFEI